jgi:hypothetical protein
MESSGGTGDQPFEVSDSIENVYPTDENEGANVCRVAAISTMLGGDALAIREVNDEVAELGFSSSLSAGEFSWENLDASALLNTVSLSQDLQELRINSWGALRQDSGPDAAVSFLAAVLGSELERESAAAAAALWRDIAPLAGFPPRRVDPWGRDLSEDVYELIGPDWPDRLWFGGVSGQPYGWGAEFDDEDAVAWRPDRWRQVYDRIRAEFARSYGSVLPLSLLVRLRLGLARRSADPTTRSLANAAFLPSGDGDGDVAPAEPSVPRIGGQTLSTMIHGTFGWKGDWWRPRPGSFHDFVLSTHRPNLYSGGARFSWSGAYSRAQRVLAASDLRDWAGELAPTGVETVFAHSYGGEVAVRARGAGAAIDQLVLLSSPANKIVRTVIADSRLSVADVRLKFDPVLALARTHQRIRPRTSNVTEVILKAWRTDHAATHQENVWNAENVASRGGI